MGALCALTGGGDALNVGGTPDKALAGCAPITDGVNTAASMFYATFPYLAAPLPGATNQ